jgi:hypothetical protein
MESGVGEWRVREWSGRVELESGGRVEGEWSGVGAWESGSGAEWEAGVGERRAVSKSGKEREKWERGVGANAE